MLIGSFSVRIYNYLRLLGAYGRGILGTDRQNLSAGVAFVNNGFSISYLLRRPYYPSAQQVQAVNFDYVLML